MKKFATRTFGVRRLCRLASITKSFRRSIARQEVFASAAASFSWASCRCWVSSSSRCPYTRNERSEGYPLHLWARFVVDWLTILGTGQRRRQSRRTPKVLVPESQHETARNSAIQRSDSFISLEDANPSDSYTSRPASLACSETEPKPSARHHSVMMLTNFLAKPRRRACGSVYIFTIQTRAACFSPG